MSLLPLPLPPDYNGTTYGDYVRASLDWALRQRDGGGERPEATPGRADQRPGQWAAPSPIARWPGPGEPPIDWGSWTPRDTGGHYLPNGAWQPNMPDAPPGLAQPQVMPRVLYPGDPGYPGPPPGGYPGNVAPERPAQPPIPAWGMPKLPPGAPPPVAIPMPKLPSYSWRLGTGQQMPGASGFARAQTPWGATNLSELYTSSYRQPGQAMLSDVGTARQSGYGGPGGAALIRS